MGFCGSQPPADVCVYSGYGASHSWTWFADIFDRENFSNIFFADESDILNGVLCHCKVFFISGGDTFAIAQGLGQRGADQIASFVRGGGVYMGSCAGAYLPLKTSLSPLNRFNFVQAKIANLASVLPEQIVETEKFCTEYGCRYVFHPVREEVVMRVLRKGSGIADSIIAPLYGGPVMLPSDDMASLAVYDGFSDKTEFLVDRHTAWQTLSGNVAAAEKRYEKGVFYIFGPHFEHPDYPEANRMIFSLMQQHGIGLDQPSGGNRSPSRGGTPETVFLEVMRLLSNARIAALGLESRSVKWLIGRKYYDYEKIRVFLETMWTRARAIHRAKCGTQTDAHISEQLALFLARINRYLKELRCQASSLSCPATGPAEDLFADLRKSSALLLTAYFNLKSNGFIRNERRTGCTYTSKQRRFSTALQS